MLVCNYVGNLIQTVAGKYKHLLRKKENKKEKVSLSELMYTFKDV